MTEMPEDVMKAARKAFSSALDAPMLDAEDVKIIARVIMAERERAAKVAEAHKLLDHPRLSPGSEINAWWSGQEEAARRIAAAIRRGDT